MPLNFRNPGRLTPSEFYYDYAMPLQQCFIDISARGIRIEQNNLRALRARVDDDLSATVRRISDLLANRQVFASGTKLPSGSLNLSSPMQILETLKILRMKPPKKRRFDGTYTESTDEESLNELFSKTGHPFLKELLRVRELNKLLGTYINVETEGDILYGSFVVPGTVTGRRSCRENFLGLGSNLQNQPKHSDLAKRYRECLVANPGRIFVKCDQISAEDWIVQGLIFDQSGDDRGFAELQRHEVFDRHAALGAQLFNKPIEKCGKDSPERYMGKRVRHAGNYDMEAFRFSQIMASEGHVVSESFCQWMLDRFHSVDPGIKQTYHRYVQDQLRTTRSLTTPFGFTRQFFGLRSSYDPTGNDKKITKEGYAQIPQGTIGQNTGMAILWLETTHPGFVVLDEHDAVTGEVPDDLHSVQLAVEWLKEAFNRIIRLPNGLEFTIPIEVELGYDLAHMKTVKCADLNEIGVASIYNGLAKHPSLPALGISGVPQASSPEPSNATSG